MEILYLFRTQGQSFFLIILLDVVHSLDGLRLMVDGEHLLVETVVHALQHAVVTGVLTVYGEEFLYTRNAGETHVLRDLNGIGAPWGYHLSAWADKEACKGGGVHKCGVAIKPAEGLFLLLAGLVVHLSGNDVLLRSLEE